MVNARATLSRKLRVILFSSGISHLGQAVEHLVVEQVIEPMHGRLPAEQLDGVQDQVARHSSDDQRHRQQHQQCQAGVHARVLLQRGPEFLGIEPELFEIHKLKRFFCRSGRGRLEHLSGVGFGFTTNQLIKYPLFATVCIKKLGLSARNRYPMQLFFCMSSR
jgi:hypothetical protein